MVFYGGSEQAYGQSRYVIISAATASGKASPEQNDLQIVLQAGPNEYIHLNDMCMWTESGGTTANFRALILAGFPKKGTFVNDDPTEGMSAVPIGKSATTITAGTNQNPATAIQLWPYYGNMLLGPGQALCVIATNTTVTEGDKTWISVSGVSFPTTDAVRFNG